MNNSGAPMRQWVKMSYSCACMYSISRRDSCLFRDHGSARRMPLLMRFMPPCVACSSSSDNTSNRELLRFRDWPDTLRPERGFGSTASALLEQQIQGLSVCDNAGGGVRCSSRYTSVFSVSSAVLTVPALVQQHHDDFEATDVVVNFPPKKRSSSVVMEETVLSSERSRKFQPD